jgi:predicted ATPase
VTNNITLSEDGGNLAAVLLRMSQHQPAAYQAIRQTVQVVAPFFDDFQLRTETRGGEEQVRLDWLQRGSQTPFQPVHLSDGTLRFMALTTALMQPIPPPLVVVDEPELGLHPAAIALLGEAIRSASTRTQVIVATQSPQLLDCFDPSEIVVVERHDGASQFRRLNAAGLQQWRSEYTTGEIWLKNLVGGRPARD